MQAGRLDRRVTVQQFTETEDALGTPIQTWTDAQTLYATVTYGTGREQRESAQEQSALPATFIVRSSSFTRGLTPQNARLTYDGQTFDITSIAPGARRREYLTITATARTS